MKIMDLVRHEQPGFQQIASGWVLKLLGNIVAFEKQKGFSGKPVKAMIEESCLRKKWVYHHRLLPGTIESDE